LNHQDTIPIFHHYLKSNRHSPESFCPTGVKEDKFTKKSKNKDWIYKIFQTSFPFVVLGALGASWFLLPLAKGQRVVVKWAFVRRFKLKIASGLFFLFFIFIPVHSPAQSVKRTIDEMNFRQVAIDDPLLGPAFKQKEAFYSIRPPAGWKFVSKLGPLEKKLQYPVRFENPKTGDFLSVGLLQGGPKTLSIESLSRFRGDYLGSVKKAGIGKVVGSDLFGFGHHECLQVLLQQKEKVVLQLLVFDEPGSFAQLVFSAGQGHYHEIARTIEASIASFEWPSL